MLERMFDPEDRRVADEIEAAAEQLRELGRKAVQGLWHAAPTEDRTIFVRGRDDQLVVTLSGPAAAGTARFMTALRPDVAYFLAELMSSAVPAVRQGQLPSRVQAALHDIAKTLLRNRNSEQATAD